MNITKLTIKNLYGYINKEIIFNDDINLLVGINGSGKTSVLNVINWLLIPSFPDLCTNEFDELSLEFTFKKEEYKLISRQNTQEVTIDITNLTRNKKYNQIQADFTIHPKKINNADPFEDYSFSYKNLTPEKHEIETWNFLFETLPNPIVIGLDRNLYTEEGDEITYIEDNNNLRKRMNPTSRIKSPLDKVIKLSGSEFNRYKNLIFDLNKRLNNKIMLSSFEETMTVESINDLLKSPKITIKQVETLEVKVKDYFKDNVIDKRVNNLSILKQNNEAFNKIEKYFLNLKILLKQIENEKKEKFDIVYITNLNQFKKIKELIKDFEDFENKSRKFYESIKQYLDTINIFLKDSAKELYFDKITSKLKYRVLDKKNNIIKDNMEIKDLSSGEKQILILFTYIKFNNKFGKVFIIDEPELSLHPKWQENFLIGIKNIMPPETQLLFATHSPAIVGNNKDYCKILLPY